MPAGETIVPRIFGIRSRCIGTAFSSDPDEMHVRKPSIASAKAPGGWRTPKAPPQPGPAEPPPGFGVRQPSAALASVAQAISPWSNDLLGSERKPPRAGALQNSEEVRAQ